MPRISQGSAVKGRQKWIQKLVNEKPDLLNSLIRTQLDLPDTDTITWRSPIAEDVGMQSILMGAFYRG